MSFVSFVAHLLITELKNDYRTVDIIMHSEPGHHEDHVKLFRILASCLFILVSRDSHRERSIPCMKNNKIADDMKRYLIVDPFRMNSFSICHSIQSNRTIQHRLESIGGNGQVGLLCYFPQSVPVSFDHLWQHSAVSTNQFQAFCTVEKLMLITAIVGPLQHVVSGSFAYEHHPPCFIPVI